MKICFVCQGNIIRSSLAENIFRQLAEERGIGDKYTLDSAGSSSYHVGEAPDRRMRQVAAEQGLVYSGSARQFHRDDFNHFDLIIAMDKSNQRRIAEWASSPDQLGKVHLMREYDPLGGPELDVPDPYYGGVDGFKTTFEIVERSCAGLMEELEGAQHTS